MVVLFVTSHSQISTGGDSRVAWELARYAAKYTSHQIYILAPGEVFDLRNDKEVENLEVLTIPSTKMTSSEGVFKVNPSNISKLIKILNSLNIDIIHAHNFFPISFIVQSWAVEKNIPFVYTSHVLPTQALQFQSKDSFKEEILAVQSPILTYLKLFHKGCSSIIALNTYAKEDCDKYLKGSGRIDIIPNGCNFKLSNDSSITKSPEKSDSHMLFFSGCISKRKNQIYLVKSLRNITNRKKLKLILAGEYADQQETEKIFKEKEQITNANIQLPGFISHEQILEYLKQSHFFVSASTMEVQSLSVIEALASGTPVIALKNETTKELIQNDFNGYLLPKDTSEEDFGETIEKALNMEDSEYRRMCLNSIKSVQHLTWENVWKRTEGVYKELIREKRKKKDINEKNILKRISSVFNVNKNGEWESKNKKQNSKALNYLVLGLLAVVIPVGVSSFKKHAEKKKVENG